jgi:hypothetical protein
MAGGVKVRKGGPAGVKEAIVGGVGLASAISVLSTRAVGLAATAAAVSLPPRSGVAVAAGKEEIVTHAARLNKETKLIKDFIARFISPLLS